MIFEVLDVISFEVLNNIILEFLDVFIFEVLDNIIFKSWMFSFLMQGMVSFQILSCLGVIFHGVNVIIFEVLDEISLLCREFKKKIMV
jgi:hypothetical protein